MSAQGKISLDWGYIFDLLAISELKSQRLENGPKRDIVLKAIENMWNEMERQLGKRIYDIYNSPEYTALFDVNLETWEQVDLAEQRNDVVANLNSRRYELKKQLQEKFFNSPISEQKGRS